MLSKLTKYLDIKGYILKIVVHWNILRVAFSQFENVNTQFATDDLIASENSNKKTFILNFYKATQYLQHRLSYKELAEQSKYFSLILINNVGPSNGENLDLIKI